LGKETGFIIFLYIFYSSEQEAGIETFFVFLRC